MRGIYPASFNVDIECCASGSGAADALPLCFIGETGNECFSNALAATLYLAVFLLAVMVGGAPKTNMHATCVICRPSH